MFNVVVVAEEENNRRQEVVVVRSNKKKHQQKRHSSTCLRRPVAIALSGAIGLRYTGFPLGLAHAFARLQSIAGYIAIEGF